MDWATMSNFLDFIIPSTHVSGIKYLGFFLYGYWHYLIADFKLLVKNNKSLRLKCFSGGGLCDAP